MLLIHQKIDHVTYRESRRFLQIRTKPHADVMGGSFGSWPQQMLVLVDDKLKSASQEGLERGDVDLAVALGGVPVAHLKERSLDMHRYVQRRSGNQLLVIHIARMHPWRTAVDAAGRFRRRDAHAPEERMQRNLDSRSKLPDHLLPIQRNDLGSPVRIIVGQKTTPGSESVTGP